MYKFYKLLDKNKHCLTPQQYKTLKGQLKAGDIDGAMKGFNRIIRGQSK